MRLTRKELDLRSEKLRRGMASCTLCPRRCGVNRLKGETKYCRLDSRLKISSIGAHHGEEPPISGSRGSGTIFFSHCNLKCVYCQNYQISQKDIGYIISEEKLADEMIRLQSQGCHNINLVSPTHQIAGIVKALAIAVEKGLEIPILYNSNGYDSVETLELLDGMIDIYMPDIKYSDDKIAKKYSDADSYVENNRAALTEMFRQVGNLRLDKNGAAQKGILVRHLVLANNLAGSYEALKFLASLSKDLWISCMAQYHPCYHANKFPEINRNITPQEYKQVLKWIDEFGFNNILSQDLASHAVYLPNFKRKNPFRF